MPYDGSGNFTRVMRWQNDAAASIPIKADRHDQEDDNFASGLSNVLTKDGQSQPSANIPLNGKKLINVGAPTAAGDAATKAYVDSIKTFTEAVSITGNDAKGRLGFTGTQTPTTGVPLGITFSQTQLMFGVKPAGIPGAGDVDRFLWMDSANSNAEAMALTHDGKLTVRSDANFNGHNNIFTDTLDGATVGPIINLRRDNATRVVDDNIGQILWQARDSTGGTTWQTYADLFVRVKDYTNGTEDAEMWLRRVVNGTLTQAIILNADGVAITGKLTATGAELSTTKLTGVTTLYSPAGGAAQSPILVLERENGAPLDNDLLGTLYFRGYDSGGTVIDYCRILSQAVDVTAGTVDGALLFQTYLNGAQATRFTVDGDGVTVSGVTTSTGRVQSNAATFVGTATAAYLGLDSGGSGTIYFRPKGYDSPTNQSYIDANGVFFNYAAIHSVNGNGIYSDSNGAFVGIASQTILGPPADTAGTIHLRPSGYNSGTGAMTVAATTGNVTVGGTLTTGGSIVVAASNNTGLTAQWDDGGASVGPYVTLSRLSPTPAAGDGLGGVLMNGRNSGAANVTYGQIYVRADTVTAGAEDSTIILNNYKDGSARTVMSLSSTQITLNDDTVISGAGTLTVGGTITTTGAVNTGALVATGNITATGNLTAQGANVFSGQNFISTTGFLYLAATGAGQIAFRPNGIASNSGQTTLASSGDLTVNGSVTAVGAGITAGGAVTSTQNFISSTANCYLGPTGAGTIILRPNGVGSGTGQFIVGSTGNATVNGTLTTDNVIFPATPVVSANANTLDTYEEGTWTPVVAGVTTAGAGTYTTQSGRYTKIGKSVFIECVIVWTAHTGTGGILITGLPFTSASVMATSGCINATNLTFAGQLTIQINATNTTINVISMTTGAAAANVAMDTAATIWINGHYTAAN